MHTHPRRISSQAHHVLGIPRGKGEDTQSEPKADEGEETVTAMSGAVNVFSEDHSQDPTGEAPDLTPGVRRGWCDGRCRRAWGLTFHVLAGRAASTLRVQDEHACVSSLERTIWVRQKHVCEPHQSCWQRCVPWRGHSPVRRASWRKCCF